MSVVDERDVSIETRPPSPSVKVFPLSDQATELGDPVKEAERDTKRLLMKLIWVGNDRDDPTRDLIQRLA